MDVPYWDVKVDPSIIKDHGDIWNERAEAMMAAIFRMTNPMLNRNVKPRATLHRPPDFNRLGASIKTQIGSDLLQAALLANGADGISDPAAAGLREKQRVNGTARTRATHLSHATVRRRA